MLKMSARQDKKCLVRGTRVANQVRTCLFSFSLGCTHTVHGSYVVRRSFRLLKCELLLMATRKREVNLFVVSTLAVCSLVRSHNKMHETVRRIWDNATWKVNCARCVGVILLVAKASFAFLYRALSLTSLFFSLNLSCFPSSFISFYVQCN